MNTQPETSLIQLEIDGCIARVTLARSDKYNALNVQMISELIEYLLGQQRTLLVLLESSNLKMVNPTSEFLFCQEKANISVLEPTST